ncbi:hypothetical protein ABIB49_003052 [Arthrobacter sp. UYCu512]
MPPAVYAIHWELVLDTSLEVAGTGLIPGRPSSFLHTLSLSSGNRARWCMQQITTITRLRLNKDFKFPPATGPV